MVFIKNFGQFCLADTSAAVSPAVPPAAAFCFFPAANCRRYPLWGNGWQVPAAAAVGEVFFYSLRNLFSFGILLFISFFKYPV